MNDELIKTKMTKAEASEAESSEEDSTEEDSTEEESTEEEPTKTNSEKTEEVLFNEKGEKTKIILFYPDGSIKSEGFFKDDKLNGPYNTYFEGEERILESSVEFKDGMLHGKTVSYLENGLKYQEMSFLGGKLNGLFRLYQTGNLQCEITYFEGKKKGLMTYYADNGTIRSTTQYDNDMMHGESVSYDENNGQIVQRVMYEKNMKHGLSLTYYPNYMGRIYEEAIYKKNVCEGFVTRYYPDGRVMEVREYKAGQATGDPLSFSQSGVPLDKSGRKISFWLRIRMFFKRTFGFA